MTRRDPTILLCVTYTLGFGIHIVGEIVNQRIRFTCLVRPKLPNVHDRLQVPLEVFEGAIIAPSSRRVSSESVGRSCSVRSCGCSESRYPRCRYLRWSGFCTRSRQERPPQFAV